MDETELCARNVSAALRESLNALNASEKIQGGVKIEKGISQAISSLREVSVHLTVMQEGFGKPRKD